MSEAAYRQSKEVRRRCESCDQRKARFSHRGVVKADRDHSLCFECFRSAREHHRAQLLADVPRASDGGRLVDAVRRTLTAREIDHRQRMLAHLAGERGA